MIAPRIIAFLDIDGDKFPLRKETYLIGRKTNEEGSECSCDILLRCMSVSLKHSILDLSQDKFQIMDLKSKFGTFLDGEQLPKLTYSPFSGTTTVKFGELQGKIRFAECDDEENRRQSPDFIYPSQKRLSTFQNFQLNNAIEIPPDCNDNEIAVGKCTGSNKKITENEKICADFDAQENEKNAFIENTSNGVDSFIVPETQYFQNSVNHYDQSTDHLDSGDSFLVPETQTECLSIANNFNVAQNDNGGRQHFNFVNIENCSQTNAKSQKSCDYYPNIRSQDESIITLSEIRICTQDFNDIDIFDETVHAENNSNDLLANIPNSLANPCEASNLQHQQSANVYHQESHSSSVRDNAATSDAMKSSLSKVDECIQVPEMVEILTIQKVNFNLNTIENENSIDPEMFNKHKNKQRNKSIEINELEATQIFQLPVQEKETSFDECLPATQMFNKRTEQQVGKNNDSCEIETTQLFKVPLRKSKPVEKTTSVNINQVETSTCNDAQFSEITPLSRVLQQPEETENNDEDDELQLTQIFNVPQLHEPKSSEVEDINKNVENSNSSYTSFSSKSPLSVNQTINGFNKEKSPVLIKMKTPECNSNNDGFMCTPKFIADKFVKVVDTNISHTYLGASDDDEDDDTDVIGETKPAPSTKFEELLVCRNKNEKCDLPKDIKPKKNHKSNIKSEGHVKTRAQARHATNKNNSNLLNSTKSATSSSPSKRSLLSHTIVDDISAKICTRRITRLMSKTDCVREKPGKQFISNSNAPAIEKNKVSYEGGGGSKRKTRLDDKKNQEKSLVYNESGIRDISSTENSSSLHVGEIINIMENNGEEPKRKNQDNSSPVRQGSKRKTRLDAKKIQEKSLVYNKSGNRDDISSTKNSSSLHVGEIINLTDDDEEQNQVSPLKRMRHNDSIVAGVLLNDKETGKRSQFKVCVSMVDQHLLSELQKKSKEVWTIVDNPNNCDVLVMNKGNRTYKFLIAMAKGIPIVTSEWLDQLNKSGSASHVPLTDYLFYDPAFEKRHRFKIQESLRAAKNRRLFHKIQFLATANIRPTSKEIEEIVKCSGGIFLQEISSIDQNKEVFLVSNEKDNREWHKFRRQSTSITIISTEGVMSSVIRQNLRPLFANVLS